MSTSHFCLLVACLLPIVCAGIAKWGKFSTPAEQGGYDNREPRVWLAQQSGFRSRANAAQANSFEALPVFLAGLWVAHSRAADPAWIDALSLSFIGLRVFYIGLYVANLAVWRSLAWTAGFAVSVSLFLLPAHT